MPSVMRVDRISIMIFPNDHPPPHVHAVGPDGEARFALNCPAGPIAMMDSDGLSRAALTRVRGRLTQRLDMLCSRWRSLHG